MSVPRRLAAVAVAVAALAGPPAAEAGEYTVLQCDPRHVTHDDARFDRTDGAYYRGSRHCAAAEPGGGLRIGNLAPAPPGAEGRISWLAPAGTAVVGVRAEALLRRDHGHRSRLGFLDSRGRPAGRIASGGEEPGGYVTEAARLEGVGRAGFAAQLVCISAIRCAASEQARTWIRSLRLTLLDSSPPTLELAGPLVGGGWLRGSQALALSAEDEGGGLRRIEATVDGAPIAPSALLPCHLVGRSGLAQTLRPCPPRSGSSTALDTTAAPFVNGPNRLVVCAEDLGTPANRVCRSDQLEVDNAPPLAALRAGNRSDPELIRALASDAHSGLGRVAISYRRLAGGQWMDAVTERVAGGAEARIDSRSVPAGRYLFRLAATDLAGNATTTARADDGRPLVLEFPLVERTVLRSHLATLGHRVAYGDRPKIRGRLRVAGGGGLARRPVELLERFEPGSRPRRRARTVTTGRDGSFEARLSPGPSRTVIVRYAGDRRYMSSAAHPRKLAVLGRVGLRLSRDRLSAGGRVRFRGRVGTRGVAVAAPGKLVELQVRESGHRRFRTVRSALHAGASGRVRSTYRFGRFYTRPVSYEFRLKLTREAGWPYRAPAHSPLRRLVVMPR